MEQYDDKPLFSSTARMRHKQSVISTPAGTLVPTWQGHPAESQGVQFGEMVPYDEVNALLPGQNRSNYLLTKHSGAPYAGWRDLEARYATGGGPGAFCGCIVRVRGALCVCAVRCAL